MNSRVDDKKTTVVRRLIRLMFFLLVIVGIPLGFLVGCQSKLLYFPRPYRPGLIDQWSARTNGKTVDFKTTQGKQRAFLQGNLKSPRNLWIVCGGNGTVALDWSMWIAGNAPEDDAFLLVDFPGYGNCEGSPNPQRLRESLRTVVPLAWTQVGLSGNPDPARLRFFGHSLGAAVCLIAASEFSMQRGVLISPFTSTMDMTRALTGIPLGFLVMHRFDNSARLAELAERGPGEVIIFHGSDDEVIPVEMSRKLAAEQESVVRLVVVPAHHNDVQGQSEGAVAEALRDVGR